MGYNIQFQLCGLLLVTLIILLYVGRRALSLPSEKVYSGVLFTVELYLMFDIASVLSAYLSEDKLMLVSVIISKIALFLQPCVFAMILLYTLMDIHKKGKKFRKEFRFYSMMLLILPLMLFFTPIEKGQKYGFSFLKGSSVKLAFIYSSMFMLLILAYTLRYHRTMNRQRRNSIYFLVGSCIISSWIQIIYPHILVMGYCIALSMVFMYMRLENPGENIDKVTGCFTQDALVMYIKDKNVRQKNYALFTLSFDDFKFVNETFGSTNGNLVIAAVSEYLRQLKGAVVFRGMELELTVVFEKEADMQNAYKQTIERFKKPWNEFGVDVNLSVGLVCLSDSTLISQAQELVEVLHYFVQEGKNRGKGIIIDINKEELAKKNEMDNADAALRWAMKHGKVDVYYQPIYSLAEKSYVSAEALVRVTDKNGKFVSPDIFIPLAERNGLILELGMLVFEKVCKFMKEQQLVKDGIHYIEINLSVVQCMKDDLAQELLEMMKQYNIPPEMINLEITETAAVNSEKTLIQNMEKLIARKVTFSLDDYGSGYSNLSYIVGLPLQIVKLDKSLVWSSFENEKAKVAMEFAVSMIRQLGMKVLAEGIETQEQYNRMQEMNIDFIQGFFFSRPIPEQQFMKLIKEPVNVQVK